jgi:signal peptidase I
MQFFLIRRSKHLLKSAYFSWKKSRPFISATTYQEVGQQLESFQKAIIHKNKTAIIAMTPIIHGLIKQKLSIPLWLKAKDFFIGLIIAIIAAFGLIRPIWFELYQIPSGSMRPTLKEMDRLTVSKAQFGINIPLTVGHLLFEKDQVKRNGIVIFTGQGMDIPGGMTDYFYFFKGAKQYVKRLIGKPGDTLYFYGGKIFGIDADGHCLDHELDLRQLSAIDHIPFLNFEGIVKPKGKAGQAVLSPVSFYQNGVEVLRMQYLNQQVQSDIVYTNGQPISDYYDLFGIGHFGLSRIVKKDKYYLEILHHPSVKGAKIQPDLYGRFLPTLATSKSYLPLDDGMLRTLYQNLYTARFTVKNGLMKRSSQNHPPLDEKSSHVYPRLIDIPDGTYEFDQGIAYSVLSQGITKKLDADHPLNQYSIDKAVTLFNYGIEFDLAYSPDSPYKLFPSRYTYYRFGDLYVMGQKLLTKTDQRLVAFIQDENQRVKSSIDFIPFIDRVPPLKDSSVDPDFIRRYGLKVPNDHYYVLGDNHAMSADSRRFGFVPEKNLRGVPDLLFWPFGSRWGKPLQADYPLLTVSRLIVWMLAGLSYMAYRFVQKWRGTFPYSFEKK